MTVSRRIFATLASIALLASQSATAADFPTKPIRLLVGFPAGSAPDIIARYVTAPMADKLGQPIVVEPRPGAGSNIATETVVRAAPDGYTLLLCSGSNTWNMTLYQKLPFNFLEDTVPVGAIHRGPSVLVVNPSVPAKDIAELIAWLKANPGKVNMASNGNGSVGHIYGSLFRMMTGVDMVHVPYRDNPIPELLDGRTQVYFSPMTSAIEFIRTGKLRALGVTSPGRWSSLPDVPAVAEFVPGFEAFGWMGLCAPKNTPKEVVAILNRELNAALNLPDIRRRIVEIGGEVMPGTPEAFGAFMANYMQSWAKVIRFAGIKVE
jgi:tripartite-type tricarboxylate transporter receptor subunit TctC